MGTSVVIQEGDLKAQIELLKYKLNTIDFIDAPADLPYDCPLDVHCSYTRDQLLLALDFMKPKTLREGVKWLNYRRRLSAGH